MKNKLTKKKAEEFSKALCGTAKGLEIGTSENWTISSGFITYDFWSFDNRIYCQIGVGGHIISSYFFNFETLEPDFEFTDNYKMKNRDEEFRQDRLEFLYWLRDDSKINIPDDLIEKYSPRV